MTESGLELSLYTKGRSKLWRSRFELSWTDSTLRFHVCCLSSYFVYKYDNSMHHPSAHFTAVTNFTSSASGGYKCISSAWTPANLPPPSPLPAISKTVCASAALNLKGMSDTAFIGQEVGRLGSLPQRRKHNTCARRWKYKQERQLRPFAQLDFTLCSKEQCKILGEANTIKRH